MIAVGVGRAVLHLDDIFAAGGKSIAERGAARRHGLRGKPRAVRAENRHVGRERSAGAGRLNGYDIARIDHRKGIEFAFAHGAGIDGRVRNSRGVGHRGIALDPEPAVEIDCGIDAEVMRCRRLDQGGLGKRHPSRGEDGVVAAAADDVLDRNKRVRLGGRGGCACNEIDYPRRRVAGIIGRIEPRATV